MEIDGKADEQYTILKALEANGIHAFPEPYIDIWVRASAQGSFCYDLADAVYFLFENVDLTKEDVPSKSRNYFLQYWIGKTFPIHALAYLSNNVTKCQGTSGMIIPTRWTTVIL